MKKEILMALGKTPIIKDQKLFIEANEWLVPIKNEYPALEAEYKRLELSKTLSNKAKTEVLSSVRTHWLPELDSNQQQADYIDPSVSKRDGLYHHP